ncbi:MAG: hypothetical protein ABIH19_02200 [Candidatus Omnitrophota bacterium]
MKKIFLTVALIVICSPAFADLIVLKNGDTVEGKVIEEAKDYVKIERVGIELTYFSEEIESVEIEPEPLNWPSKEYLEQLNYFIETSAPVIAAKMNKLSKIQDDEELRDSTQEEITGEINKASAQMEMLRPPEGFAEYQQSRVGEIEVVRQTVEALFQGGQAGGVVSPGIDAAMLQEQLQKTLQGQGYEGIREQLMQKLQER